MVSGTLVMLASAVHIVAKYYQRPEQSSNKILILQTKFEFRKKTNLTSLVTAQMLSIGERDAAAAAATDLYIYILDTVPPIRIV